MAYYTNGYQYNVPIGYQSREGVAAIQQQLNAQGANLKVDGIWGPKTDAAYTASGGGYNATGYGSQSQYGAYGNPDSYMTTDLSSLYQQVLTTLNPPTVSYSMPSRSELSYENASILRPAYDHAIEQRQRQTLSNRAEIDVDAASRGMGRSSYVTDVKDRAMDSEAYDIARLEGEYAAALAAAVQQQYDKHLQNKLAADQFNANAQAAAQNAAFSYATTLHKNNLSQAQAMADAMAAAQLQGNSSSGKRASSSSTGYSNAMIAEMQNTALGIYGGATSQQDLTNKVKDIQQNKPYDGIYQQGASDFIAGILDGMR